MADSALYSQENLLLIKDLKWITRVPLSIKASLHLVTEIIEATLTENSEIIATEKKRAGRFILATNILEAQQLTAVTL